MAIAYCSTQAILDSVLLELTDTSATMRAKALAWLNQAIRDILNQPREWKFMEMVIPLVVTDSQTALPAGAQEIIYLKLGDTFYDPANLLSDEAVQSGLYPGYTLDPDGTITFFPPTDATTCELKYEAGLDTKYTDVETETILPIRFENLLISGTLMKCFKFDKDGRFSAESAIFDYQMKLMKAWDNNLKSIPAIDPRGLTRTFEAGIQAAPTAGGASGALSVVYTNVVKAADGNMYSLSITDNGDGTFSPVFTRTL